MHTDPLSNAVSALTAGGGTAAPILNFQSPGAAAAPFSGLFENAIGNLQTLESQASSAVQGLMDGSGVDVHQAMIATQKSDMAFEMALAVRNKAVAAYQQVMQMQF